MLSQNRQDNSYVPDHIDSSKKVVQVSQYRVMLSQQSLDEHTDLLDRVIDFAFDILGARRLQLRVYDDA
jgi:hypothetical protein